MSDTPDRVEPHPHRPGSLGLPLPTAPNLETEMNATEKTTVVVVSSIYPASGGFGMYDVAPGSVYYSGMESVSDYMHWATGENDNLKRLDDDEIEHINGNLYGQGNGTIVGFRDESDEDNVSHTYELVEVVEVTDNESACRAGCVEIGSFTFGDGTAGRLYGTGGDWGNYREIESLWDEWEPTADAADAADDEARLKIQIFVDAGGIWIPDAK